MNTNPTTQAQRRYTIQMTLAMAAYVLILFGTRSVMNHLSGPSRLIAAVLPVFPVIVVFVAVVRWLRNTDEFNRRIVIEALAIAAGITALCSAAYGFLEGDYLPRLSIWWTWSILMGSWLVASLVLKRRYQ